MNVQYAALPYRRTKHDGIEVLLITSRHGRQWIVPKGWPEKKMNAHKVAAAEALEEAGVRGRIKRKPVGQFRHRKGRGTPKAISLDVMVFPLRVKKQKRNWPEKKQRQATWLSVAEAAQLATSKGLRDLIKRFSQNRRSSLG